MKLVKSLKTLETFHALFQNSAVHMQILNITNKHFFPYQVLNTLLSGPKCISGSQRLCFILIPILCFRGSSGSWPAEWRPRVGGGRGGPRPRLPAPGAPRASGRPPATGAPHPGPGRGSRGRGADEQETHSQTRHQAAPGQSKALHLSFLSKEPH